MWSETLGFYGVMMYESTKLFVTNHLVVIASFVDEGLYLCSFFYIVAYWIGEKVRACIVSETLTKNHKGMEIEFY